MVRAILAATSDGDGVAVDEDTESIERRSEDWSRDASEEFVMSKPVADSAGVPVSRAARRRTKSPAASGPAPVTRGPEPRSTVDRDVVDT